MEREPAHFPNISFSLAKGSHREALLETRRTIYTDELGYHGIDEFDQQARHIGAFTLDGRIVAACRILGPEQRPLEIESDVDLDRLLGPLRRPAQIGGLWVHPEFRKVREGFMLPLALMRCLYIIAERHNVTDLVLRTHVAAVRPLYLRIGFVERTDFAYRHPQWGEVFVMSLDLEHLRAGSSDSNDFLKRFVLHGRLANIDLDD